MFATSPWFSTTECPPLVHLQHWCAWGCCWASSFPRAVTGGLCLLRCRPQQACTTCREPTALKPLKYGLTPTQTLWKTPPLRYRVTRWRSSDCEWWVGIHEGGLWKATRALWQRSGVYGVGNGSPENQFLAELAAEHYSQAPRKQGKREALRASNQFNIEGSGAK